MAQWEYKVGKATGSPDHRESEMNALGAQGWELVGISELALYYKRPIADPFAHHLAEEPQPGFKPWHKRSM